MLFSGGRPSPLLENLSYCTDFMSIHEQNKCNWYHYSSNKCVLNLLYVRFVTEQNRFIHQIATNIIKTDRQKKSIWNDVSLRKTVTIGYTGGKNSL